VIAVVKSAGLRARRSPLDIARAALARGRACGADLEVYVQSGRTVDVKVFGGRAESITVAEPQGLGVRAVRGGRTGYAFTTDLRMSGIDRALAQACANLEAADADPLAELSPAPVGGYPVVPELWRPGVSALGLDRKVGLALQAESAALGVAGVENVEESVYSDEEVCIAIASTVGVEAETEQSYCYLYVVAHAGVGKEKQSGLGFCAGREPDVLDAAQAGCDAAAKALALRGAGPCPTGTYTVVFDREVTAALVSSIVQALSADAVQKRRSVFAGRVGSTLGSPLLTLVDDGLAPEGMATSPFDGEGVPCQATVLIEGGVLRSYLFDSYTARRAGEGTASTGNAARSSYRALPRVGASNLVIGPGSGTLEQLVARVGEGLYVQSVAGLNAGVNPVSGEVSLGATGRLIEGGELGKPVREVTVATDFLSLLSGIDDLAADGRWIPLHGSVHAPAVAAKGIAVAGSPTMG